MLSKACARESRVASRSIAAVQNARIFATDARAGSFRWVATSWVRPPSFGYRAMSTRLPSFQRIRIERGARADVTSTGRGSHARRRAGVAHSAYTARAGYGSVRDVPTCHPWDVSCRSRRPRARSYSTVTIWLHPSGHPYRSWTIVAISGCRIVFAPARSRSRNHSAHRRPVFAFTASSEIEGVTPGSRRGGR
ncbi:MAG: hypothetical protein ACT4PT_09080 [Methanobacteriota archaeon]